MRESLGLDDMLYSKGRKGGNIFSPFPARAYTKLKKAQRLKCLQMSRNPTEVEGKRIL